MTRLEREIDRLKDLIEDMLRLSRLDQARIDFDLQPVDLNELASQYVEDRDPLARSRNLELTFSAGPDGSSVLADPGLLGQALSVLLTNALYYTPGGGSICVSVETQEDGGEPWAGFRVRDTGPGILADDLAHLFERFYRGKAGRDSGAPGTGLGLAIAREIVSRHRGRIEVSSEGVPGRGATFTVWLPVTDQR